MLLEQPHVYHFFKNLLMKGLSNDGCCIGQNASCKLPHGSHHPVGLKYIVKTFNQIRNVYNQDNHLPDIHTTIKYITLANANRMLCVYEEDFQRPAITVNDVFPTLVTYILLGYNFKQSGEACPMMFVHDIINTYANSTDMALTENELQTLMMRLNLTQASLPERQPHHNGHNHAPRASDDVTGTPELSLQIQRNRTSVLEKQNADRDDKLAVSGRFVPRPKYKRAQHDNSVPDPNHDHTQHGSNRHSTSEEMQLYNLNTLGVSNTSFTDKCLSPNDIHRIFSNKPSRTMDLRNFLDICPILLQQVLTESCRTNKHDIKTSVNSTETNVTLSTEEDSRNRAQEYLYGSLSVLVISVCSLFGAVFMKLSNSAMKHYIMGSMLALAVGCLIADAILHLLPEISALDTKESSGDKLLPDNLQKLCSMLASIYGFFLLELYLCRKGQGHGHTHGPVDQPNVKTPRENDGERIKETNLTPLNRTSATNYVNNKLQQTSSTYSNVQQELRKLENIVASNTDSRQNSGQSIELHSELLHETSSNHSNSTVEQQHSADQSVDVRAKKAIAWMIIIGDGVHNFADGLAVGAAFSLSFTKGLSTSITIFCHELPHELGDFAVLISTGMTVKRAMVFNFLSSLTAFVGLYVGLVLGDQPEASKWIFAIGAGMFLYVAMTDLIPECKEYFKRTPNWKMLLGQNIGILLGYLGMLLLAMFEEKLEIQLE